ncbi:MFS transporter [Noviherbaspirillum galbum]|uniref:Putative tartrate transporter n=1 Tax=Noviherbaspirillum galbum TaxID=2709383 RepID=A0A6B3SM83_9BURK|nr:MFS transporter [Noviherbaspirillum galbum]NEX61964.1 MFS transporter [Noviherbaspirillum galbum]
MTATTLASASESFEEATYSKVSWRLIPFLFLCYVVAFLDRVNVGFAKLQMLSDLKFSETIYGLGAGIFFIGYFLMEVPSNIVLSRVGARVWIARIMVTWGVISSAMMFVNSPLSFYALRFLLGVAEAGFFPGIILYLTYWYPARRRAKIVALFMTAIAFSGVIGGPLSGWVMNSMSGVGGLAGWQWMFLLEGVPSVFVGIAVLAYLDDGIRAARWLNDEEKSFLEKEVREDQRQTADLGMAKVFSNGKVWALSLIYFSFSMGLYGVGFWLPQLIKSTGVKDVLTVGLLTAIPYGAAAVTMVLVGRNSDRTGERRWHTAIPAVIGSLGLIASTLFAGNTTIAMLALTVATACILTVLPLFWTLPTGYLGGTAAAAGIAMINSLGGLGGFASPYMVGAIKDATQNTTLGMYVLAGLLVLGAVLVIAAIPRNMAR